MDHPFRSAAFGGFNRQDVLDYLEKTAAENARKQQELQRRLEEAEEALARRRGEYRALELALEVLSQANGELQARFSPALNRRAGQLFSALTGGKYEELTLTRAFEAEAREAGGVLPRRTVSLSRGTVDQL